MEAAEEGEEAVPSRLGSPSHFAAELRAAAGLQSAPAADTSRPGVVARSLALARRLAARPRVAGVLRALRELAPIWWVVRAYVAVAAFALANGATWTPAHPSLPRLHNGRLGVLVLLGAGALSLALGLRLRRRPLRGRGRGAFAALNVALVVAAVPVAHHLTVDQRPVSYFYGGDDGTEIPRELTFDGQRVTNIYPYGRDGHLLQDVRLFDGFGRPINVSGPRAHDPARRVPRSAAGRHLYNSFPVRYYDPGTHTVRHPAAGARARVAPVVTRRSAAGAGPAP